MVKKKKKSKSKLKSITKDDDNDVDHGTPEKHQHGIYVEAQTISAGVKALRNVTVDPLETYVHRKSITQDQYDAGDRFATDYRLAHLTTVYARMRFNDRGGDVTDHMVERTQIAKESVRRALKSVGFPLAHVLVHVLGDCEQAGTWSGVKSSKRKQQDGMTALRLALDGLIEHYRLKG